MRYLLFALIFAVGMNILTLHLRTIIHLEQGDPFFDTLPFMSGWISCLIFSLRDKK